ncbi:response regulator transcription factor [Fibrella forsythiae]|uniref:Response regulator transcription factor n=1 Tax=Fibrella forsythiae TaxID=2817061 RepID=A0ABS3JQ69_9BACT|nr:response regulator transcription factor [Fibrella forsythiae]MBO0952151.1 response regulator transcription factor [Fibrella forsythiae]
MTPRARILYVEDDINLSFVTRDNLEAAEFAVYHCTSGTDGWTAFQTGSFDLCLLDVMLPQTDGFALARQIRAVNTDVPILFLSARADRADRLTGLRLGADDYLTKPFSIDELLLKIDVFLKRSRATVPPATAQVRAASSLPVIGTYLFDQANLTLLRAGLNDVLTQREADVLAFLLNRANTVVRRDDLLRAIWGDDDYFMGRSLDVFISRLRKRLSADPAVRIDSVHGVGFRLVIPAVS